MNYPAYCVDLGPLNCIAVGLLQGYAVALSTEAVFIGPYSRVEKRKNSTAFKMYKKNDFVQHRSAGQFHNGTPAPRVRRCRCFAQAEIGTTVALTLHVSL